MPLNNIMKLHQDVGVGMLHHLTLTRYKEFGITRAETSVMPLKGVIPKFPMVQ